MKIVRFDAPNHTFAEIGTILSTIGYRFFSYDEIYWLVGIESNNDQKKICAFFEAVGFKHVMVVSIDMYGELDSSDTKQIDTITLTKYVLVYRMYNNNKTFCFSAINPSLKARLNADYIFAPGVYPVPMKDRYGIFSNSHANVPSDAELMHLMAC